LSGSAAGSTNGSGPVSPLPVGPGRPDEADSRTRSHDPHRAIATSPAVGIYQPRPDLTPGTRVRNGDRIGSVNMLGVPQEVVAPADGVIGVSFADAGDAVEYGQELVSIELVTHTGQATEPADGRPGGSLAGGA
jgi:biotin carboxyl carrier protein